MCFENAWNKAIPKGQFPPYLQWIPNSIASDSLYRFMEQKGEREREAMEGHFPFEEDQDPKLIHLNVEYYLEDSCNKRHKPNTCPY